MNKHTKVITQDMSSLADDAQALMSATAEVAGEKVAEARQRLAAALGQMRKKAVESARAADEAIHEHPYKAIALGVGIGALLGYLVARRCSSKSD